MRELIPLFLVVLFAGGVWWLLRGRRVPSGGVEPQGTPKPASAPRAQPTEGVHWPGNGDFDFEVVGESFYQKELARFAGAHGEQSVRLECIATLVPEDDNKHDAKAVAVLIEGRKVAHLSRDDARSFRRRLGQKGLSGATTTCDALIVGGGKRRNGENLMYGVKLDIKPFR